MTRRIPISMRLKAWWQGYDLRLKERPFEVPDEEPPAHNITYEREKMPWETARIELAQALWGSGMISPGDPEFVQDMVKPLGLNNEMSVLDMGAGLGGCARVMAESFGAWVTALEEDVALAEAGAALSDAAGMGRRAPVTQANLSEAELKQRGYDAIFSKDAFFRIIDKQHLLDHLVKALKPRGQLLFTDYVVDSPESLDGSLSEWLQREPMAPHPWTAAEYQKNLVSRNIEIRVQEDITHRFVQMIRSAWAEYLDHTHNQRPEEELAKVMMSEAELWTGRAAAMESGHLRVYRFHGIFHGGKQVRH